MSKFELSASLRSDLGKGASRRLRSENLVPAIMYGAGELPAALSLQHHHVLKALESEAFYSHILTLHINDEKHQVVLKDLQRHPYKPRILHMDFLRINAKEKLNIHVPLHFIGEDKAPGIKQGAVFTHLLANVEVRCLPADLPEFINVDVSQMNLDDTIHLSELVLPKGVEITAFLHGGAKEDHDEGVIKLHLPRAAVEEPAPVAETSAATPATAAKPLETGKGDVKK